MALVDSNKTRGLACETNRDLQVAVSGGTYHCFTETPLKATPRCRPGGWPGQRDSSEGYGVASSRVGQGKRRHQWHMAVILALQRLRWGSRVQGKPGLHKTRLKKTKREGKKHRGEEINTRDLQDGDGAGMEQRALSRGESAPQRTRGQPAAPGRYSGAVRGRSVSSSSFPGRCWNTDTQQHRQSSAVAARAPALA